MKHFYFKKLYCVSWPCPHLPWLFLCNIPNYSSSAAWSTISRVVSNDGVTMLSAHVSQWEDRIRIIWPITALRLSGPSCLLQCVSPWLSKVVLKTIRWWGCHITSLITTYNPEQLIFTDCFEIYNLCCCLQL